MAKIRQGFVSNSSSSSFIFNFKTNDKEQCKQIINKYKEYFNLYNLEFNEELLPEEVLPLIFDHLDSLDMDYLNDLLQITSENKQRYLEELNKSDEFDDMYHDFFIEESFKEDLINDLMKDGFKYYFTMDFGDNHGDVQGGKIGKIMDHLGRYIFITKKDVIMYTEQNR